MKFGVVESMLRDNRTRVSMCKLEWSSLDSSLTYNDDSSEFEREYYSMSSLNKLNC